MRRHTRRINAGTPQGAKPGRRRVMWIVAAVAGVFLLMGVCILVCLSIVRDAARDQHGRQDHYHPPGPHGGAMVAVGRENRFHVEAVFERAGQIRVYTYGEDESQVYPVDAQPVPATARQPSDPTEFSVLLSPEPQPGDPPGKASRFVGQLPKELDAERVELVVAAMNFGGEQHWFAVKSEGEWHRDPMPEKVTAEEERKLYLTPSGKYTEADIKASGSVTASEKFRGLKAEHDANPKPGDRICPVSLTKANPKFTWVIGGREYQFCCPPCVDEFVRKAKERPDEVKPPESYIVPP
jgi:YHS domain-containing protein